MQPLKKIVALITTAVLLFVVVSACKKDHSPYYPIEGFDILDQVGNEITHVGPTDNDWTFGATLSAAEMALFDFPVPENLSNTTQATLSPKFAVYPNPAGLQQNCTFSASDSVLLRIVVVNSSLKVLTKGAIKFKGAYTVQLDYSADSQSFPDGASLRIYYSVSAASKLNYKVGYGDIKMCYNSTPGNYMDCF
jgi:hypothetical protein